MFPSSRACALRELKQAGDRPQSRVSDDTTSEPRTAEETS